MSKGVKRSFYEYVKLVAPWYVWYKHCEVLGEQLQRIADGELKRLMVYEPPRHGKTIQGSKLFPAYFLDEYPEKFVGVNSYAAELAYTLSRAARDFYIEGGGVLKSDAAAVKHWETQSGGGLWAAGVGGAITGKGFHLGIIDDPLKNAEEAASEVIRAKQKDWYDSTFYTREEPGGAQFITQTRWHEDDVSGYLLQKELEESPENWTILCLSAIKEPSIFAFPETCRLIPDWRQDGEALCPERYPIEKLTKIRDKIGSYYWNALYRQNPQPREGNMFKREWFQILPAAPNRLGAYVRYWDNAATEGGGCYTAGVLMGKDAENNLYVLDVVRGQWSPKERNDVQRQTCFLDTQRHGSGVQFWVEEEPGGSGKETAQRQIANFLGFIAYSEKVTGDKVFRAEPFAAQAEARNVFLVAGDWNKAYLDELCGFPNGKYKDQVDASSGACNKLALMIVGGGLPKVDKRAIIQTPSVSLPRAR